MEDIINDIKNAFENNQYFLTLESEIKLLLLPLGQSYQSELRENEILVYKDLFDNNPDFYSSLLFSKLGRNKTVYAREVTVGQVSREIFVSFCEKYHYLKGAKCKVTYGLFFEGELIMVAGFSKPRLMYREDKKFHSAELIRTATKHYTTVTGGLSKLINRFITDYKPTDIVTTIDKDFFDGNSYKSLGFRVYKDLPPFRTWLDLGNNKRFSTSQLIKKKELRPEDIETLFVPKGYSLMLNQGSLKLVLEI